MRFRRLILGLSIMTLVSGIFLFASTMVRETRTSTWGSSAWGGVPGETFSYGGISGPLANRPQAIVGTTGLSDLMILTTPWSDFNNWVCNHIPVPVLRPGDGWSCTTFGGGGPFNLTILYSYLQTHPSQIAYSKTIFNENITLNSLEHYASWTDVTVVLAYMGTDWMRFYFKTTFTNQTSSYPLIGYTERKGTFWSLPNISLGIVAGGTGLLALTMTRGPGQKPGRPRVLQGPTLQRCRQCGGQNLFFATKCLHCGTPLRESTSVIAVTSR